MKKPMQYLLLAVMIVSAIFTVWLPIYIWPKEVALEYDAVIFEEGNPAISEPATIQIKGHINNRMFGGRRYLGKIIIEELEVPEEWRTQTVRINFNIKGMGIMYFLEEKEGDYELVPFAYVSMGDKATSTVLSLIKDRDADTHMFAGSTMVAGPASDRAAAVRVSNELMNKFLDNPIE